MLLKIGKLRAEDKICSFSKSALFLIKQQGISRSKTNFGLISLLCLICFSDITWKRLKQRDKPCSGRSTTEEANTTSSDSAQVTDLLASFSSASVNKGLNWKGLFTSRTIRPMANMVRKGKREPSMNDWMNLCSRIEQKLQLFSTHWEDYCKLLCFPTYNLAELFRWNPLLSVL